MLSSYHHCVNTEMTRSWRDSRSSEVDTTRVQLKIEMHFRRDLILRWTSNMKTTRLLRPPSLAAPLHTGSTEKQREKTGDSSAAHNRLTWRKQNLPPCVLRRVSGGDVVGGDYLLIPPSASLHNNEGATARYCICWSTDSACASCSKACC